MPTIQKTVTAVCALALFMTLVGTDALCGARDHENGFFLRLAAGGGYAKTKIDIADQSLKFDGAGADIDIAIGAIISPNLAIHGTLFGWILEDPDVTADSSGTTTLSGTLEGDVDLSGFGVGLTYYFMPVNIYISGTVGLGIISIEGLDDSDTGFAGAFTVGKEWWVGDKWGLGVAVGLTYHSVGDAIIDENWSGIGVPIRFTATMN